MLGIVWNMLVNKLCYMVFVGMLLVDLLICVEFEVVFDCSFYWFGYLMLLLKLCGEFWLIDLVFVECVLLFWCIGFKCFYVLLIVLEDFLLLCGVILLYDYYDYFDCDMVFVFVVIIGVFVMMLGVGDWLIEWGIDVNKVC